LALVNGNRIELNSLLRALGETRTFTSFTGERRSCRQTGRVRCLTKLFLIILLTAKAYQWINAGQTVVQQVVAQSGLALPHKLAASYKTGLADTFGQADLKDKSFWQLLVGGHILDALLFGLFAILSLLALALMAVITWVQKAALLICWSVCPLLFACLAIPPLAHLGANHLMRMLAILCWPLGFAVAATFSDALLHIALNDRLLATGSVLLTPAAALESLLIIVVVGLWSVLSTVLAPVFIQRFLVGRGGCAQVIPVASERLSSIVLPIIARVIVAGGWTVESLRSLWRRVRSRDDSSRRPPPPPPPPPPPESPNPPTSLPGNAPGPSDTTGAQRLQELLKRH
jgi:hypothetical protein